MTDDLRDRIAVVLYETFLAPISMCDAEVLAEAVIVELGLHEEELDGYVIRNGLGQTIRRRKSRWRYVTDWITTAREPRSVGKLKFTGDGA